MSGCEGLHCPGCRHGGSGKAVVIGGGALAAHLAAEWVASHAWEALAVPLACGVLAVATVVALMRWGDRREARDALAGRKLPCPDCGAALRPWGRVRERTVRELGGATLTVRPDRARCTGCGVTHVVLDAGLLPRHAYSAALVGQALVAAARGRGHRLIAGQLAVPHSTVRGWIRRARASARHLWALGVQAVVTLDPDALPTQSRPDQLAYALDALARISTQPVRGKVQASP